MFVFAVVMTALLCVTPAPAQQQKPSRDADQNRAGAAQTGEGDADKGAKEKRAWSLRMSKEAPHTFSVKAKEARLSEITGELSRRLKVPIFSSPLLEKQLVSLDFSGINLEGTLRMFAPQVYIDYESGGEDQYQPKPLAIYLHGMNEPPPSTTQVVKGNSEALLIEGDTEEGVGDEEARKKREAEEPLRVSYAKNFLSVRARKQPLTVVLYKIANELGIPFEMRYESPEVVDVEFNDYSVEQAFRSLSPAVRLYYRLDLLTYGVQPLRIVLSAPASGKP